jgi:hypothetical protein
MSFDRMLKVCSGVVLLALMTGCASLGTLSSEVSSYGDWPADRKPGTYAFERLPSQQSRAEAQQTIEDAARGALASAGFEPVAAGGVPDVLVQVGARATRYEVSPWADPLWWRGGFAPWRYRPWAGPRWSPWGLEDWSRVEREVALLIRDRATGKPLYETRASNSASTAFDASILRAMFNAALKDFPAVALNPREVTVPVGD